MRLNTRTGKVQFDKQEIRTLEKAEKLLESISEHVGTMKSAATEARQLVIQLIIQITKEQPAEKEPAK